MSLLVDLKPDEVKKALVSLAIENALLEIGHAALEEVGYRLYVNHHCYFMDCLEHPEYLKDILSEVFGPSHDSIIKSIKKNLEEFIDQKPIAEFFVAISE